MKKQEIIKIYTGSADKYGSLIEDLFDNIWDNLLSRVKILPHDRILDLGCGTGKTLNRIMHRQNHLELTGVDICPEMIVEAQKRNLSEATREGQRIRLCCEDGIEYLKNTGKEEYNLAVASFLLGYVNARALFSQMSRVIKPDGQLIILVTSKNEMDQIAKDFFWFFVSHLFVFNPFKLLASHINVAPPSEKIIKELQRAGFEKIEMEKVMLRLEFEDPMECFKWLDGSGFATGVFDVTRLMPQEKKYKIFEEGIAYCEERGISYIGVPIKRHSSFIFTLPVVTIIAGK